MSDVTRILTAIERGDVQAADELLPIVYEELRLLAAQLLSRERPGQTLQATALVHEAYLRLVGSEDEGWQGRRHFFGAAAEAMRRILVDSARRKKSAKRGGSWHRVSLTEVDLAAPAPPSADILALDEALSKLAQTAPRQAELVKLRYFAGLTTAQAADVLGVSCPTADRDWAYARSWLYVELSEADEKPAE
jgi:RNA polymerase sigma factor (TIGR02999 family)